MNMRGFKAVYALICALMLSSTASAQLKIVSGERLREVSSPRLSADSASLRFQTTQIHAAPMTEDDPPLIYRYPFMNVGKESVVIKSVRTTCTCASAYCDKTSLAPDESGVIAVRYDPKGHPGRFERKIFVYTDDGSAPAAILKLCVDVSSDDEWSREYPVQMGRIRLRRNEVHFAKGVKAVEKIRFVNISEKPLSLRCEEMFLPECIRFETHPETLAAESEGEIVISYDPSFESRHKSVRLILQGLGVSPRQSVINITFD